MTANELRAKVCAQARQWLEVEEADGSFRTIIDIYNGIRPLPRGYKMTYSDAWCAAFVSAVGAACGLSDVILPECACDAMIALYKARGRWVEADDYPARPGDLIFYDWQDSGVGDNLGSSDHVGIVVEDNEHYFTVVEGNYSDAVRKRTIAHNSRYIRGFAVPDYESAATGAQEAATAPQSGAALLDKPGGVITANDAQEGAETRETCSVTLPVLRYGDGLDDPDETVRAAQLLLIGRGYRCGAVGADGEFGGKTLTAVKRLQTAEGLETSGVVGAVEWQKLLGIKVKIKIGGKK